MQYIIYSQNNSTEPINNKTTVILSNKTQSQQGYSDLIQRKEPYRVVTQEAKKVYNSKKLKVKRVLYKF